MAKIHVKYEDKYDTGGGGAGMGEAFSHLVFGQNDQPGHNDVDNIS